MYALLRAEGWYSIFRSVWKRFIIVHCLRFNALVIKYLSQRIEVYWLISTKGFSSSVCLSRLLTIGLFRIVQSISNHYATA